MTDKVYSRQSLIRATNNFNISQFKSHHIILDNNDIELSYQGFVRNRDKFYNSDWFRIPKTIEDYKFIMDRIYLNVDEPVKKEIDALLDIKYKRAEYLSKQTEEWKEYFLQDLFTIFELVEYATVIAFAKAERAKVAIKDRNDYIKKTVQEHLNSAKFYVGEKGVEKGYLEKVQQNVNGLIRELISPVKKEGVPNNTYVCGIDFYRNTLKSVFGYLFLFITERKAIKENVYKEKPALIRTWLMAHEILGCKKYIFDSRECSVVFCSSNQMIPIRDIATNVSYYVGDSKTDETKPNNKGLMGIKDGGAEILHEFLKLKILTNTNMTSNQFLYELHYLDCIYSVLVPANQLLEFRVLSPSFCRYDNNFDNSENTLADKMSLDAKVEAKMNEIVKSYAENDIKVSNAVAEEIEKVENKDEIVKKTTKAEKPKKKKKAFTKKIEGNKKISKKRKKDDTLDLIAQNIKLSNRQLYVTAKEVVPNLIEKLHTEYESKATPNIASRCNSEDEFITSYLYEVMQNDLVNGKIATTGMNEKDNIMLNISDINKSVNRYISNVKRRKARK